MSHENSLRIKKMMNICLTRSVRIQVQNKYKKSGDSPPCVKDYIKHFQNLFFSEFLRDLGPVVQSIASLTSSLRGRLVKWFMTL